MGFFRRLRQGIARALRRKPKGYTPPPPSRRRRHPPPPPPAPPPAPPSDEGPQLPPNWSVVSLHYYGQSPVFVTSWRDLTNADVEGADAIRIAFTDPDTGIPYHRTIHGAPNKAGLVDLIIRVITVVSPP